MLTRRELLALMGSALTGCGYTPARSPKVPATTTGQLDISSGSVREELPAPSLFIVDVHCHTFNARDIPIDGFIRSLARGYGMPAYLDPVLKTVTTPFHTFLRRNTQLDVGEQGGGPPEQPKGDPVQALLDRLDWLQRHHLLAGNDAISRYVRMAQVAIQSRVGMAERIVEANRPGAGRRCAVSLFTPALVDFEYWIKDNKKHVLGAWTPLDQQIQYHGRVARIAARDLNPNLDGAKFHPFVPFNPRREIDGALDDTGHGPALRLVHEALQNHGFVGVKLYPASGFKPLGNERLHEFKHGNLGIQLDAAMDRLFAYCQTNQIPILAHASAGNSFKPDAAWRGSPWAWRHVLERYPSLRVCFGHFGGLEGTDGYGTPLDCVSWAQGFAELINEYDNVYADLSDSDAGLPKTSDREAYQREFLYWLCGALSDPEKGPKLAQRIAYGSDWWMNVRAGMDHVFLPNLRQMVTDGMAPVCAKLEQNHLDFQKDFFGYNALRFLGILDSAGNVVNGGTVARLGKIYEEGNRHWPRPWWLTPKSGPA